MVSIRTLMDQETRWYIASPYKTEKVDHLSANFKIKTFIMDRIFEGSERFRMHRKSTEA